MPGVKLVSPVIKELYEKAGVFEASYRDGGKEMIPELSRKVNYNSILEAFREKEKNEETQEKKDSYSRLLKLLSVFDDINSPEYQLLGDSEGLGVDELITDNQVVVLESVGALKSTRRFAFGVITSAFCEFATTSQNGYLAPDSNETILVIDEADKVLSLETLSLNMYDNFTTLNDVVRAKKQFEEIANRGLYLFSFTEKLRNMAIPYVACSDIIGKVDNKAHTRDAEEAFQVIKSCCKLAASSAGDS